MNLSIEMVHKYSTGKPDISITRLPIFHRFDVTKDGRLILYPIGWADPILKPKAKLKKAIKVRGRKA
jgi:hypothetical protein